MEVVLMKKYLLAIERRPNDYIPISWNFSFLYNQKDINSLEEIDNLTSSTDETLLKVQFISENLLNEEYLHNPLVIIFEENGKTRKLPSAIVNNDEKKALNIFYIYNFLLNNIRQRKIMNRIYNKFKDKKVSGDLESILKNINNYQEYKNDIFIASLSKLSSLPYEEIRELGLFIKRDLEKLLNEEKEIKLAKVGYKNGQL